MAVGSGSTGDSHIRFALVLVLLYMVVLMLASFYLPPAFCPLGIKRTAIPTNPLRLQPSNKVLDEKKIYKL